MLIQAGLATSFPSCQAGFAGQLPENAIPPAYTYKVISDPANLTLKSFSGFGQRRFEFNCFGVKAVDAQSLAYKIDAVLNGFRGTLSDPDATRIDGMFRTDRMGPNYQSASRNFAVLLEYLVSYYE